MLELDDAANIVRIVLVDDGQYIFDILGKLNVLFVVHSLRLDR